MISYNTLVVLVGSSLLGAGSGLVGSFAVLRRRSLTGDAVAHAALPGLCVAFMVLGRRSLPAMLAGAFASGVLGIAIISALRRWTRIKDDAAIGTVLSVFFGTGVALSGIIQHDTSTGSKAGLETYILGKTAGMLLQDIYLIAGLALFCLAMILVFYKEFKLVAFDPAFARVQGWPAGFLDLLMMLLIAVAVIIGLPAVGVVLMASLLILPGAAARFWTDQLGVMLVLSAAFGLAIGSVGTLVSATHSLFPAGPIIVLVGTSIFLFSLLFAPRRGALARIIADRKFERRLASEKLLRLFYDLTESSLPNVRAVSAIELERRTYRAAGTLRQLLSQLQRGGSIAAVREGGYRLTPAGLSRAAELERDHRLWKLLLAEQAEWIVGLADLDHESLLRSLPRAVFEEMEKKLRIAGNFPVHLLQRSAPL